MIYSHQLAITLVAFIGAWISFRLWMDARNSRLRHNCTGATSHNSTKKSNSELNGILGTVYFLTICIAILAMIYLHIGELSYFIAQLVRIAGSFSIAYTLLLLRPKKRGCPRCLVVHIINFLLIYLVVFKVGA